MIIQYAIAPKLNTIFEYSFHFCTLGYAIQHTLTTKMVLDWRKREGEWTRRARLVARDYAWIDPNRADVFAPAGGQSLIRIIPALAQLNGCSLKVLDVKDAYLMCPQPREVKFNTTGCLVVFYLANVKELQSGLAI